MIETALDDEPWIREHPNLPLVGLGGTMRNLGKINQRLRKYPLPLIHNYIMNPAEMDELLSWLSSVPAEKRKKIDGLSKDRYDIIVPGLTILHTLFNAAHASHYVVSGAGLRDGLFYEAVLPHEPGPVPERSARNLLALHPSANPQHSDQVSRIACVLFDALLEHHGLPKRCRTILKTASLLYRIGIVVNYYQFARHSFYMIAHSRLDGFTHRETLLCAMTACYKTKNRTYQQYLQYKDILLESDVELVARLGSLLRLAAALDYSQTQPVADVAAAVNGNELHVHLQTKYAPVLELKEAETLHKDFKRLWGLSLFIRHS
jgi:exopolyphosphatase/guanosine-5'-triphosphate,3'-diphosphate pyrophosphatase